jgi:hypothetical protein
VVVVVVVAAAAAVMVVIFNYAGTREVYIVWVVYE